MRLITIPGTNERVDAGAGASLARTISGGCPAGGINDGYRSYAEQVAMFLSRYRVQWSGRGLYGDVRWWRGRRYVRTSGLGMAARPGTSTHGDGLALDLARPQRTWMFAHGAAYGWFNTIRSEPWHWEYRANNDTRNIPAQEDDMTPEQATQLTDALNDIKWLKSRVGGSGDSASLTDLARDVYKNTGDTNSIVGWVKHRIGGSGSGPSLTDLLRSIYKDQAAVKSVLANYGVNGATADAIADELSKRLSN